MAGSRDCLPLVIFLLPVLLKRAHASSPTTSQLPETNPMRPRGSANGAMMLPLGDYVYDYNDYTPTPSPPRSVPSNTGGPCDYDPCRESQPPCSELAKATGCLCPGVSWNDVPPEPPALKRLSWEGSGVVLHWCAPYSYVTAYKVTVGGQERQVFREDQRSSSLGRMAREAEVCVVAVNDAGSSNGTCTTYQPQDDGLSLRAGLIGGALGFLLLFSLAVLLWRHRVRRRTDSRISTQEDPSDTPLDNRAGEA